MGGIRRICTFLGSKKKDTAGCDGGMDWQGNSAPSQACPPCRESSPSAKVLVLQTTASSVADHSLGDSDSFSGLFFGVFSAATPI